MTDSRDITAEETTGRVYFPELDGLRFIAFILVYLYHGGIPWALGSWIAGVSVAGALRDNGWVGVQLFFILSGYLIATLLLRERARYGRIDIRAFWIRRVLRIWPLYYFMVLIAFVVLPEAVKFLAGPDYHGDLSIHLPACLAFLGNWSIILYGPPPPLTQVILWSVCVEEQFYLIVPLLLARAGRRALKINVAVLMAGAVLVRWYCARSFPGNVAIRFNTFAQLDTVLSGVLLALVLGQEPKTYATKRFGTWLQWPLFGASLWLMASRTLGEGSALVKTWDFVAIWACGVGIVALAVTHRGVFRSLLSFPPLVWLGKISYGLYMYHLIALIVVHYASTQLPPFPNNELLVAIANFALTVSLAAGSFYIVERPFLRWKQAWSRTPSRPI
jgi:peptidoglycan/LPS O-acetylase OafA/YrhL